MRPKTGLKSGKSKVASSASPRVPKTVDKKRQSTKHTRVFLPHNPKAPVLSGNLESALPLHAAMRANHFFMFCVSVKMSCDVLRRMSRRMKNTPLDAIEVRHATHQIGIGYRAEGSTPAFNNSSKAMRNVQATGFSRMDAAHFNNLGLTDDFLKDFRSVIANSDPDLKAPLQKLLDFCLTFCADTRLLPQRVNLKPDIIIDDVHRTMARDLFSNPGFNTLPLVSDKTINHYVNSANIAIDSGFTANAKRTPAVPDYELANLYKPGYSDVKANLFHQLRPEIELMIDDINRVLPEGLALLENTDYIADVSFAEKTQPPEIQEMIRQFQEEKKARRANNTLLM